jgi:hypothetical protein
MPPRVSFERGQLAIAAENSSLAEILDAVRLHARASIEFPAAAWGERATVNLGPASPAIVLADLLCGSPFDYLVVGSGKDHDQIRVVLSEKTVLAEASIPPAMAAHLSDAAVVAQTAESSDPAKPQAQITEEIQPAIAGSFRATPVDETVFTPPDAEIAPNARPKIVRRTEGPRYFPHLNKQ